MRTEDGADSDQLKFAANNSIHDTASMTPPDPPKRPIGFVTPEDKGSKKAAGARGKT